MNVSRMIQMMYGLILVVFGLNGFFHYLPIPEKEGFALEFMQALEQAKYLLPAVAVIMIVSGILFLSNRGVAFALLMQLPVSFNIFAFHLFHDWQGLIVAYLIFGINNFLIIKRFNQYKILFNQ
jgi:hypothetical protein